MTLLAVERIKLFTTRSPLWCTLVALSLTIGFAALLAAVDEDNGTSIASSQFGMNFGLMVIMVMAALAVTTEYRFGTIRATFQAIPNRTSALLAKTAVVALVSGVIGELAAFGAVGISKLIQSGVDLGINTSYEWRATAGVGLIYAIGAVIAVAVGTLIRHSAGAVSLLLIYTLMVESLIGIIPNFGTDAQKWLPFSMANMFLTGEPDPTNVGSGEGPPAANAGLSPWWALAYFAGFALVMLVIAIVTTNKRDA